MIDRTRFAISTEETRCYLNGIYFHTAKEQRRAEGAGRAVATDGHRLARVEEPPPEGAAGMPGVSRAAQDGAGGAQAGGGDAGRDRDPPLRDRDPLHTIGTVSLTSRKLIDGTFPEYERVVPRGSDKVLRVEQEGVRRGGEARLGHQQRTPAAGEADAIDRNHLLLTASTPRSGPGAGGDGRGQRQLRGRTAGRSASRPAVSPTSPTER